MRLIIESQGYLFFRRMMIKEGNKPFASIKFHFSLFQHASIIINNKTWNFIERGLVNTSQFIADSNNRVIISRKLNTSQQLKNVMYINTNPLITMRIGESTYTLEKNENEQKYKWLKDGISLEIEYDLNDLIQSESKILPRFRGLWKIYATLPENAEEKITSLFFLGLFELIQKTTHVHSN